MKKTIYYRDGLNEDFAAAKIIPKPLEESYTYNHTGLLWNTGARLLYRFLAQPAAFVFVKAAFLQRFRNKSAINAAEGAYIYANHTCGCLDAFVPSLLCPNKRCGIVVGREAVSIRGLACVVEQLGGIPLGSTVKQKAEMCRFIQQKVRDGGLVTIYPEAHIWPWYTDIRPFSAAPFAYPARDGAPVYALTNCYRRRLLGSLPKVISWVDGPFFADMSLPLPERRQELRDLCYSAMKQRASAFSDYGYYTYVDMNEA